MKQRRHVEGNPKLPVEFYNYHNQGLQDLKQFVLNNIQGGFDDDTNYSIALATLTTWDGQTKLGKAIMELNDKE